MVLHEFLSSNRNELITRCRSKVGKRGSPPLTGAELEYGVPLFLGQLVEALRREEAPGAGHEHPDTAENARTAALHGKELLDKGYTVDQVVHGYGDICQSVTELAAQKNAPITVEEFHTLNRLLDNAIADAVSSYGLHRDESASGQGNQGLHDRMGALANELRTRLAVALKALEALKSGNVGLHGATGNLLEKSLLELQDLIDKSLPELRLATGMTTPPKP